MMRQARDKESRMKRIWIWMKKMMRMNGPDLGFEPELACLLPACTCACVFVEEITLPLRCWWESRVADGDQDGRGIAKFSGFTLGERERKREPASPLGNV